MKILVITSNPKKKGALASLTEEAVRGAKDVGAEVEEVRLSDCNIGYCRFCMNCFKDKDADIGPCVQDDDMQSILPKIKEADGFILVSPVSSGHANARFKTFIERCVYTAGRPGRLLWMTGPPEPRCTNKKRYAVTIVSAGVIPAWLRVFCNTATRQMVELCRCVFNAKVIGKEYAGNLADGGLTKKQLDRAYALGCALCRRIPGG